MARHRGWRKHRGSVGCRAEWRRQAGHRANHNHNLLRVDCQVFQRRRRFCSNLGPISRGAPAIVLKDFSPIHFGPIERLIGKPALWRLVGLHQLRDAGTFARIEALSTKTLVALIPVAMSRSTGSITREEAAAAAGVPLLHRGAGHLPALSDLALPISGTKIGAALAFSIFAISSPRLGAAEPGTGAPCVLVAVKERGRPLGELALSSLHADRFGLHAVIHCAIRGIAIRGIGHLRHTLAGVMLKCLQCTTFTGIAMVVSAQGQL